MERRTFTQWLRWLQSNRVDTSNQQEEEDIAVRSNL